MNRLDVALQAIKEAGQLVKEGFYQTNKSQDTKRDENDIVTEFDTKAQKIIIEHISAAFPDDKIIAEEEGYNKTDTDTGWVIDPIDGTNPFSRGIHTFAVVIGHMTKFEADFCLVYNPVLMELYVAEKGQGCFLNGKPCKIANRPTKQMLIAIEGFGSELRSHVKKTFYGFHGSHSGAFSTLLTARGSADAYITDTRHIWDRIHYILLTEAGAKLTRLNGEPYTLEFTDIIATHPDHHQYLNDEINSILAKVEKKN